MKVQVVITHVQSGKRWAGGAQALNDEELNDLKQMFKDNIGEMRYIVTDEGDLLPGDFIRSHCVISFCTTG